MYTQCPKCRAIFEVDEDVLQASLGIVYCGNCGERFDALRTLSDRVPRGADPILPRRDPETLSPILTQRVAADTDIGTDPAPAPAAATGAPRIPSAPIGGSIPDALFAASASDRTRALIAEAAGISRDAILEDQAWQVTELPVLTAIILNEPITPADLDDAATMQGESANPSVASATVAPPDAMPAPDETSVPSPTGAGTEPAAPVDPLQGVSVVWPPGTADAPIDTGTTATPTNDTAQGEATDVAIATARFLRVEDAPEPSDTAPPATLADSAASDRAPGAVDVPDPQDAVAALRDIDAPPPSAASPAVVEGATEPPMSPLERWLGGIVPGSDQANPAAPDPAAADAAAATDSGAPPDEPAGANTPGTPPAHDAPLPLAPAAAADATEARGSPAMDATAEAAAPPIDTIALDRDPVAAATPEASVAGDAPTVPEPVYVPPRARRVHTHEAWWIFGCVVLALALAAQIIWSQRAEFVRNPETRAAALEVCARIDCRLPPIRDIGRLILVARDIRPDPTRPGLLSITATLRNDAPFRQPWPLVVVRMTDIDNEVVAMRRFRPVEYLPNAARRARGIPPRTTVAVALEVRDPGRAAVGFRFDFD